MRAIKFRAWDIEKKKMLPSDDIGKWSLPTNWKKHYVLMQFIGLVDNLGHDIYEGDICGYVDDPSRFEVVFEKCAFRKKYPKWDETIERPIISQFDVDKIGLHVLGTIYEQPKLLKQ